MDRVEPSSVGGGAGMEGGGTLVHTRRGASRGESRLAVYGVVLLLVWVVVAFGQVFGGRFTTWDDDVWVERNAALAPPSGVGLGKKWLDAVDGGGVFQNLYTPLTHTVWFGVAKMGWDGTKLDPGVFKAASVGVHLVGVVGVFLLVKGVLGVVGRGGRGGRGTEADAGEEGRGMVRYHAPDGGGGWGSGRAGLWGALVGAGVFGLHPMQVEAVAWVSGMKDVLWTALMVWALVFFVGGISGRGLGKGLGGWVGIGGAWVLLAVALLTKPTAVVVPGMMMVMAVVVGWGRHGGELRGGEKGWGRVGVGVLVACLLVVPVAVVTARWQTAPLVEAVGWWWRPVVAMDAVGHYIGKVVWPVGFALDYGRSPRWVVSGGHWVWNVGVFGVAVGLLAWWRDRVAVGGAVMAVMAVGPVLGLVDFDFATFSVVSDHYGYALMVGVAMVVGAGVAGAVRWAERGAVRGAANRLGGAGSDRAGDEGNDGGVDAGNGVSSGELIPPVEGKRAGGGRLRVVGGVCSVWLGVLGGLTWAQGGVWRDSATLYQHGLEVVPESAMVNSNYAAWLQTTAVRLPRGEWEGMMRASLVHAGRAIERFEKYPQAHYLAGIAEAFLGKPEAALKHYAVAAPYFAKYADFQAKLGDVYAELGRLDEAARHYRKALEIDPGDVGAGRMLPRVEEELRRRASTRPGVSGGG